MKKIDQELILTCLVLILLTILFPPWKMDVALTGGTIGQSLNYEFSPIFSPPEGSRNGQMISGYTIDIPRLLMIWFGIVLVCGYLILIPRILKEGDNSKKESDKNTDFNKTEEDNNAP